MEGVGGELPEVGGQSQVVHYKKGSIRLQHFEGELPEKQPVVRSIDLSCARLGEKLIVNGVGLLQVNEFQEFGVPIDEALHSWVLPSLSDYHHSLVDAVRLCDVCQSVLKKFFVLVDRQQNRNEWDSSAHVELLRNVESLESHELLQSRAELFYFLRFIVLMKL